MFVICNLMKVIQQAFVIYQNIDRVICISFLEVEVQILQQIEFFEWLLIQRLKSQSFILFRQIEMQRPSHCIDFICEDNSLREQFLAYLFKRYGGESPNMPNQEVQTSKIRRLCQMIRKSTPLDLKKWTFSIQQEIFSFFPLYNASARSSSASFTLLLLDYQMNISEQAKLILKATKDEIVVLLQRSQDVSDNQIQTIYQNLINLFMRESLHLQKQNIASITLSEDLSPLEPIFLHLIRNRPLLKEVDLKLKAEEMLKAILKKYKISSQEKCFQLLMDGNLPDAYYLVSRKQRELFTKEIQQCHQLNILFQKEIQHFDKDIEKKVIEVIPQLIIEEDKKPIIEQKKINVNEVETTMTRAVGFIKNLILIFKPSDERQCISAFLSGKIEKGLSYFKLQHRSNLKEFLFQSSEYNEYLQERAFLNLMDSFDNQSLNSRDLQLNSIRQSFKGSACALFEEKLGVDEFDSKYIITLAGICPREVIVTQIVPQKVDIEKLIQSQNQKAATALNEPQSICCQLSHKEKDQEEEANSNQASLNNEIRKIIKSYHQFTEDSNEMEALELIKLGNFDKLSQQIKFTAIYDIQRELFTHEEFRSYVRNNQQKFIGKISYFSYFISSVEQINKIICALILSIEGDISQFQHDDKWLQIYVKSTIEEREKMISFEVKELTKIRVCSKQQTNEMELLFVEIHKYLILRMLHKAEEQIKSRIGQKCELTQISRRRQESIHKMYSIKNKAEREKYQRDIDNLEAAADLIQATQSYMNKLAAHDITSIAINYSKLLIQEKSSWKDLLQKSHQIRRNLSDFSVHSSLNDYLSNRTSQVRLLSFNFFYQTYEHEITSLMVPIHFKQRQARIVLDKFNTASFIFKSIAQALGGGIDELIVELVLSSKNTIIFKNDLLLEKPDQILCYAKQTIRMNFKNKFYDVKISKEICVDSLKKLITEKLKEDKIDLKSNSISMFGMFGESSLIEITDQIRNIEFNACSTLKFLKIKLIIQVIISYETELFQFLIQSDKSAEDIKALIQQKTKIPIKSQSLILIRNKKEEQIFNQKLQNLSSFRSDITFRLISKMNLEHYGFHQNYPLSYDEYSEFFIDGELQLQQMVNDCSLKQEDEKLFFAQLIKFLYAALKRKFSFSEITDQIKDKIIEKNAQYIWSGENFNQHFLVYYLMYNADKKLRIELMNSLRTFVPLPLYFRKFDSINDVKKEWILNEQILWLLHSGLCITSLGLHTQSIAIEKGKTFLNNQLLFTNFQEHQTKHLICESCPEIYLKALGNIIPLNIIDIPSGTCAEFISKILALTHVLIIHSWKSKEETQDEIVKIKQKYQISHVFCFLRDCKNKQETITKVRNANFEKDEILELHNLGESSSSKKQIPFIKILREKFWEANKKTVQSIRNTSKNISSLFNNHLFDQFEKKLKALTPKFYDMKVIFNYYETIKEKNRNKHSQLEFDNIQQIKIDAIKAGLASQLLQILLFINEHKQDCEILMLRFRQVLKELKNQEQRKYMIINHYKKKIMLLQDNKKADLKAMTDKAIRQIESLPKMKKIPKNLSQKEMVEELSNVFDYYENEIKSMFFTIQFAWRQLQYLTSMDPKAKLGNKYLLDFLIDIKRKEIANGQPFELLDGDLLQMPKNITKKVFEGITDRVAVITILGPQSSGKSTLLNFLFGCDFGTSEGRCTRGVYGTYFKFSNIRLPNCDGVFLIDTEGLFANLNKKDESRRIDFDSKLVLFCMAVSDFVIINTKGNLDSESSRILQSCMQRFGVLTQQNLKWPQIFLILNQNNSANLMTSETDINKLRELFNQNKSFSFSQAYELMEITKKDISLLPENENIVKKQPKKQFLVSTNQLQRSLMNKISLKSDFKSIGTLIDLMEIVWSTIEAFPDLGKTLSKKLQQIENKIKEWRIVKIQELTTFKDNVFEKFKKDQITETECQNEFYSKVAQVSDEFKVAFLNEKALEYTKEEERIKLQLQEKKVEIAFEGIKYQLKSQIKDVEKDKFAEKCKSEGSEAQKEAIRFVKKLQREENRQFSIEEKQKYFNEAFSKSLQRIRHISEPSKQLNNYFEKIKEYYSNAINTTSISQVKYDTNNKKAGLPKNEWKCDIEMNYHEYSNFIRQNIFELMGMENNKYIQFRQSPPTKILDKSSLTDAKLQYFNMRKYFTKDKTIFYYEIQAEDLVKCLKKDLLKEELMTIKKSVNIYLDTLSTIMKTINKFFSFNGFIIKKFQEFIAFYEYKFDKFRIMKKIVQFVYGPPKMSIEMIPTRWFNKSWEQVNKQDINQSHINKSSKIQFINNWQQDNLVKIQESLSYLNPTYSHQFFISEEQINEAKKYIKVEELMKVIQYAKKFNTNSTSYEYYLEQNIKKCINWNVVQTSVEESKQFIAITKDMTKRFKEQINKDLSKFGIIVDCQNVYDFLYREKNQKKLLKFKKKKNYNKDPFEKEIEFTNSLNNLSKFDENKIRMSMKRTKDPNDQNDCCLKLGSFYEQIFNINKQYRNNKDLAAYISDKTNEMLSSLKNESMKQFVFNELQENKSFNQLFDRIDRIIKKSPDYLNMNSQTGIYVDVCKQIIEFNNDLNQVCHRLTLIFTGYTHLYAVYMSWKKYSQLALAEANKPIQQLLEAKQKQLEFFMKETSNDDNIKSEGESDRFLNEVIQYCKTIIEDHKTFMNKMQAKKFKVQYPRKMIQEKIDLGCFSTSSKQADWINYLTNPGKVLEDKYESLTKLSISSLQLQYDKCTQVSKLIIQFKEIIAQALDKLSKNGITQDTIHTHIFSIVKKKQKEVSVTDNDVLESINILVMNYFLDLLIQEQKKTYKHTNFQLEINKQYADIKITHQASPDLKALVKKLKSNKMSLTRLLVFVDMLNKKTSQQNQNKYFEHKQKNSKSLKKGNKKVTQKIGKKESQGKAKQQYQKKQLEKFEHRTCKFLDQIQKMMKMSDENQKQYRSLIAVKICRELCPGCQRICGVEEVHTSEHECKYGHQMRALGAVKLKNGDASVIRCEEVPLMSILEFNGKQMSWKEFKQIWENKPEGSWKFNDLKENNNKELFYKTWDICGQTICKREGMNFVKSNSLDYQTMMAEGAELTHYIFALDDSASMKKQKWNELMTAFYEAIREINRLPYSDRCIRVSIILTGSTCLIHQQNCIPSVVNLAIIPRFGRTVFTSTFSTAYELMTKYVGKEKMKFVFMTDGIGEYPVQEVANIKNLMRLHKGRIDYCGIQFKSKVQVMKTISDQLGGTNTISYNTASLAKAYVEIINRK